MRVLVIEESEHALEVMQTYLEYVLPRRLGNAVLIVGEPSPDLAMDLLRGGGPFDVVVAAWKARSVECDELIRRLRSGESETGPFGTPRSAYVVLTTGDREPPHIGQDWTLVRPYTLETLACVIAERARPQKESGGSAGRCPGPLAPSRAGPHAGASLPRLRVPTLRLFPPPPGR